MSEHGGLSLLQILPTGIERTLCSPLRRINISRLEVKWEKDKQYMFFALLFFLC